MLGGLVTGRGTEGPKRLSTALRGFGGEAAPRHSGARGSVQPEWRRGECSQKPGG